MEKIDKVQSERSTWRRVRELRQTKVSRSDALLM
jgi:hypothetical protein